MRGLTRCCIFGNYAKDMLNLYSRDYRVKVGHYYLRDSYKRGGGTGRGYGYGGGSYIILAAAMPDEEDMNPEKFYNDRLSTLAAQKTAGLNPYPHEFQTTSSIMEYIQKYQSLEEGEHWKLKESLAGRLMKLRNYSQRSKLFFYDLHGPEGKVQVVARLCDFELNEDEFSKLHNSVQRGDIVGIVGFPGKSPKGELRIFSKSFTVLSHCLRRLPDREDAAVAINSNAKKFDAWTPGSGRHPDAYILKDQETRNRQRFIDLMVNTEVRKNFKTRAKVTSFIRSFLDKLDFLEVETPMMNMIAGGAAARPFLTHQ